ncbi:YqzK family protein [Microaerobacter geothermalis]|uniref:DUF4227 family protein n=1 Tax=Microaerobacter geothermalis TaxID=674972 RepID=UPI0038B2F41E|nr:YqzK family protein [Microaerobacter geothermalis]
MIISLKRLKVWMKLIAIFFVCTLFFYSLVVFMNDVLMPFHPYHEPKGDAVKVFQNYIFQNEKEMEASGLFLFLKRLALFFWMGG